MMNKSSLLTLFVSCTISVLCLTSCTYNISMAHTSGTASDVIDDNATPTATTTATIPVSVTPSQLPIPATITPKAP